MIWYFPDLFLREFWDCYSKVATEFFEYQFTRLNKFKWENCIKLQFPAPPFESINSRNATMPERQFIHFEIDVVSEPFRLLLQIKQGDEVSKNEEIRGASFFWWVYILTDKAQIKTSKHKIKNVVSRWCGVFSSLRKKECPPTFLPGTPAAASYVPQNY